MRICTWVVFEMCLALRGRGCSCASATRTTHRACRLCCREFWTTDYQERAGQALACVKDVDKLNRTACPCYRSGLTSADTRPATGVQGDNRQHVLSPIPWTFLISLWSPLQHMLQGISLGILAGAQGTMRLCCCNCRLVLSHRDIPLYLLCTPLVDRTPAISGAHRSSITWLQPQLTTLWELGSSGWLSPRSCMESQLCRYTHTSAEATRMAWS